MKCDHEQTGCFLTNLLRLKVTVVNLGFGNILEAYLRKYDASLEINDGQLTYFIEVRCTSVNKGNYMWNVR